MSNTDMLARQVSVFLENKSGRLAEVCRTLGEHDINIRALCIADTSDFGILRLIVDDPDQTVDVLQAAGFSVGSTGVLPLRIPDVPGGLGGVLTLLEHAEVNVEYMYAFFVTVEGDAVVLFKVHDDALDRTVEALREAGVGIIPSAEVYGL